MAAVGVNGGRALVTGAHGLLGAWLTAALLERGVEVVALRRPEPVPSSLALLGLADQVIDVPGDLREEGVIEAALAEHGATAVFHLGAQTQVGAAREDPGATFDTNIRGTWLLLEACRRHRLEAVLVASSDKAYGPSAELPYREDQGLAPTFPYDVSKAATDLLARSYWHTYGVPVAVTRCANLYGGADTNRERLIPEAIGAVLAGRPPVLRSDGSPERDFLHVGDAVSAYLALWPALRDGRGRGEAFNAGGGRPHRVAEVVAIIGRLAGREVDPVIHGHGVPPGEIDRQWVDTGKLTALTGWEPQVALEDGLADTLAWYRAHPHALADDAGRARGTR